jgi:hypothetical protein
MLLLVSVVYADLQYGKAAFQIQRALFGAFSRGELGFDPAVDDQCIQS